MSALRILADWTAASAIFAAAWSIVVGTIKGSST